MNETDATIQAKNARLAMIAEFVLPLGGILNGNVLAIGGVFIDVSAFSVDKLLLAIWKDGLKQGRSDMAAELRDFGAR